jgi:hypothetical protein
MTLFGVAAIGSLNLALRQQNRVAAKVNCLQNARFIASVISTELKQGVPNESATQGWQTLTPPLSANSIPPSGPTAVQTPTMLSPTNTTLIFMEPHPTNYDPLNASWTPLNAQGYQRIRYFATGVGANVTVGGTVRATNTTLMREVIRYNPAGAVASTTSEAIATGAAINVTYTSLARDLVQIEVISGESPRSPTDCAQKTDPAYRTTCYIVGR